MAAMAGIDSKSLVSQADIVKQIWKELPKHMDTPVAPLDEEMLVDLAKEPAVIGGGHWEREPTHGGSRGFEKVGVVMVLPTTFPGWCFGTFFIFPNSWDDDPIWRTHIFQGGGEKTPTSFCLKDAPLDEKWDGLQTIGIPDSM